MGKYSGLNTWDVADLEIKEAIEVLERLGASEADKELITGMIREVYYLLVQSHATGRATEAFMEAKGFEYKFLDILPFILKEHEKSYNEMKAYEKLKNEGEDERDD